MFSSKSLFFVTVLSTLFTAGSAVQMVNPTGLVQCRNTTLEWTGGKAPFTVEVYTTCEDDHDDAIATWTGVLGRSVEYYVNRVSGRGVFVRVIDADDDDDFSNDVFIGGPEDDSDKCWKSITDAKRQTQTFVIEPPAVPSSSAAPSPTSSPAPAAADDASDSGPTTQAGGSGTGTGVNTGSGVGAAGVANAAQGPDNKKAGTAANVYEANGASSGKAFSALTLAAGLFGAAFASIL